MSMRSNYSDQFLADALPLLDALIMEGYEMSPDLIQALYNVYGSDKWGEQTSSMAGLGAAPEKDEGDSVAFDDPIQGYDKTYQHSTYAIAVSFSEEIVEDDKMDLIGKTYKSLGESMHQTRQIQAASVFNNGFADVGPDGLSLFHATHALIGGGTYGNRPATDIALSVAGLREMEVDMLNQVNHRNININLSVETLLASPDRKHVAKELLRSQDRPDTANRAINTFYDENYKLYIWPYLTSSSAWFALAPKSRHELRFYNRVAPSAKSWIHDSSGDVNTRMRCRFSQGYSDWIGTWGTSG